jgi:hypothetical protein
MTGNQSIQNLSIASRQGHRRTVGEVHEEAHIYRGHDREGQGEGVMTLANLAMPEVKPDCNWTRPMRRFESAFMNAIWIEVWGALTPASKGRAPNHMQLVQYVKVFRSYMGKHRENTTQLDVKGMTEGKEIDFEKILCGIPSSQVPGSNDIVYTTGNSPMEMKSPILQVKTKCCVNENTL